MKPPIFRPAAAADVEDAYRWYEAQQAGLGEEFLAAVSTALESVAANPERFPWVFVLVGAAFVITQAAPR